MIQEVFDGAKCTDLYAEEGEREWHVIERADGSISFYYTYARSISGAHYVVFDTLDGTPPSAYAQAQLETVSKLYAACGALLREAGIVLGR